MKPAVVALLSLVSLLSGLAPSKLFAQSPAMESAVAYNDFIVEEQNKIGVILIDFLDEMGQEIVDEDALWSLHDSIVWQIGASTEAVKALPAYEGNVELRDAAIALFGFYHQSIGTGYKTLLEIITRQTYTEEEIETLNSIVESITAEEAAYDLRYQDAQTSFALTHGIELTENELNERFNE